MNIKASLIIILLIGVSLVSIKLPLVMAATVYIRQDGSIFPLTAPIHSEDNVTYALISDITDSIVIQRSGITLDGAGFTTSGGGGGAGLNLAAISGITVKNLSIHGFYFGIDLTSVRDCVIFNNSVMSCSYDGIQLLDSYNNSISHNTIANNLNDGIKLLDNSSDNSIYGNTLTANGDDGIQASDGSGNNLAYNLISENTGTDQARGIYISNSTSNFVIGNVISNNWYGVELSNSTDQKIEENEISDNMVYGIRADSSINSTIVSNSLMNEVTGISCYGCRGSSINNNTVIENTDSGIRLDSCSTCMLESNSAISNNFAGIHLRYSSNITVFGNDVNANNNGVWLTGSSNNSIIANTLAYNNNGTGLTSNSRSNVLYHNNFLDNVQQAVPDSANTWDNGLEGNFWSNFSSSDTDRNGIADSVYMVTTGNTDNFPLMGLFRHFSTSVGIEVELISNSTVEKFEYNKYLTNSTIGLQVSNMTEAQTYGFCRVNIANALILEVNEVTINGSTPNYLNYPAYDNGTNKWIYFDYAHSTLEIAIIGFDLEPPNIRIISPLNDSYSTNTISLEFSVDELASWMGFSLDGQEIETIGGNSSLLSLSEGAHSLVVLANDTAGNTGQSDPVEFSVDTIAPSIAILFPENQTYNFNLIPLNLVTNEPTSWIGYSLDDRANATIPGNVTLPVLNDGPHTIIVYANDTTSNMGSSSSVQFTVDTIAPLVIITSPSAEVYPTDNVPLEFYVDAATSWVGYSLDNENNITIAGNTTLSGLSDGFHTIIIYAADTSGNTGWSSSVSFGIDNTPPSITNVIQNPSKGSVTPDDSVIVNATIADDVSDVKEAILNYTIDNATWVALEMIRFGGDSWGTVIQPYPYGTTVIYSVVAQDYANNSISTESLGYTYDYSVVPEFPLTATIALMLPLTILLGYAFRRRYLHASSCAYSS